MMLNNIQQTQYVTCIWDSSFLKLDVRISSVWISDKHKNMQLSLGTKTSQVH